MTAISLLPSIRTQRRQGSETGHWANSALYAVLHGSDVQKIDLTAPKICRRPSDDAEFQWKIRI
jgi:hypothetical protein